MLEYVNRPLRFIGLTALLGLVGVGCGVVIGVAAILTFLSTFLGIVAVLGGCALLIFIMLGFSLVYYVAVDMPDMGLTECMKYSWELMSGRRWEFFVLRLSFILWSLACIFVIPVFWVTPYMSITTANYYNLISGQLPLENHPPQEPRPWPGFEEHPPQDND